jgi:hypothetical protein
MRKINVLAPPGQKGKAAFLNTSLLVCCRVPAPATMGLVLPEQGCHFRWRSPDE